MRSNNALKTFTTGKSFQSFVSLMIILCSITLGVETFYPEHKVIFVLLDFFFTVFFAFEIVLRIFAASPPLQFFKLFSIQNKKVNVTDEGFWNWFDFVIVSVSVASLFGHFFEHPEFLVVSRLFRVLRVLRLLEISSELKAVEQKIVSIIPTIFSFALLLGILLYIYSIIGIYLFSHHQYESADFSTLGNAFLSLFQLMTLDGWSDMMHAASKHYDNSWWIKGYFVSFVILTAIISFNVFVAVLTSQVHEKVIEDQKQNKKQLKDIKGELAETEQEVQQGFKQVLSELQALRSEIEQIKKQK
ncbi:MAG: ion transporter [Cyclobacteriaceae bacterium]|jgi:voltage-gated sodium channel|nr:ion transporter [Cyclobacteriaceae bacterium]